MPIEDNPFDHILYEFSMYLQTCLFRSNNQFITNLLIDSRMVHTRNLAYFFGPVQMADSYMHYSKFITTNVDPTVDKALYDQIQNVTSNSTCHLLKGRMRNSNKQNALQFEQQFFPVLSAAIRSFIDELNTSVRSEYSAQWTDPNIQKYAADIIQMIPKQP